MLPTHDDDDDDADDENKFSVYIYNNYLIITAYISYLLYFFKRIKA